MDYNRGPGPDNVKREPVDYNNRNPEVKWEPDYDRREGSGPPRGGWNNNNNNNKSDQNFGDDWRNYSKEGHDESGPGGRGGSQSSRGGHRGNSVGREGSGPPPG